MPSVLGIARQRTRIFASQKQGGKSSAPAKAVAFCSAKQGGWVMKTSKTIFHRVLSMLLTAAMVVTLFTVAAPTEAQAAGLSFKGNGKSTVKIADSKCWVSNTKMAVNYIK